MRDAAPVDHVHVGAALAAGWGAQRPDRRPRQRRGSAGPDSFWYWRA